MESTPLDPTLAFWVIGWIVSSVITGTLFWQGKIPGYYWGDKAEDGGPGGMSFVAFASILGPIFIVGSLIGGLVDVIRRRRSR